jgi:hypothetical protein
MAVAVDSHSQNQQLSLFGEGLWRCRSGRRRALGVSVDFLEHHVLHELGIVRRGRRRVESHGAHRLAPLLSRAIARDGLRPRPRPGDGAAALVGEAEQEGELRRGGSEGVRGPEHVDLRVVGVGACPGDPRGGPLGTRRIRLPGPVDHSMRTGAGGVTAGRHRGLVRQLLPPDHPESLAGIERELGCGRNVGRRSRHSRTRCCRSTSHGAAPSASGANGLCTTSSSLAWPTAPDTVSSVTSACAAVLRIRPQFVSDELRLFP